MLGSRRACAVLAVLALGCGGSEPAAPPARQPDASVGCAPGDVMRADGGCRPAGVPDDSCAPGFEHDGAGGCRALMPPTACPPGQMAIPGDQACRPVAVCDPGTWGSAPDEPGRFHVDASAPSGGDGSATKPFASIGEALDVAPPDGLVVVARGTYAEALTIDEGVRLWGACPDGVDLVGDSSSATVLIASVPAKVEIRSLAILGSGTALAVTDADVLVDEVWFRDPGFSPIQATDAFGPVDLAVRRSLLEGGTEFGIFAAGVHVSVDETVVRGTDGALSGEYGRCINAIAGKTWAEITVRASVLEGCRHTGLYVSGSTASVEGVVIRDIRSEGLGASGGYGVIANTQVDAIARARVDVIASVIERARDASVRALASEVLLDRVVVRDTQPADGTGDWGVGAVFGINVAGERSTASVRDSLFDGNREVAILVAGGDLSLEGSVVRATLPRGSDGYFGGGIAAEHDALEGAATTLAVKSCRIEDNRDVGIFVAGADALIESTLVAGTQTLNTGDYGDGILVARHSAAADVPTSAKVLGSRVETNARAGLATFGSSLSLGQSTISCNSVDIDGELYLDAEFSLEDLGGNSCGCPEATGTCKVLTSSLEPPQAVH